MADSTSSPASQFCDYGQIVAALLSEIELVMRVDRQTIAEITGRMESMEAAGVANYGLYWLNIYLYRAYHKTATRPRYREYVGKSQDRIKAEVEAVERRDQHKRLRRELKAIEQRGFRVARALSNIIRVTKKEI